MTQPVKMIIDTDPGIDDAMAIFYAAGAQDIDLLGLTTVFGNVTVETATRNALRLVERAGLECPVAQGAVKPLVLPAITPSAWVHGAEGFGDIPAETPKGGAVDETAAEFLVRMAREHKGELVVCAVGPITNIAEAIRLDPAFTQNLKQLVFMGGAAHVPGNITAFAEANTYHDPHALAEVINAGGDIVMVGLDVTMKALCKTEDFAEVAHASPYLGGFVDEMSKFYLKFYESVGEDGCGLHDPMAVIACTHPHWFDMRQEAITVILDGDEIGNTVPVKDGPMINVCVGGDMEVVKAHYLAVSKENP
ncbi:nucleoside hydrolase [Cochlodiniinecator piscidefendens]|uniref:nucleoside hydrolase n=1 Tax=Cochlodiniinecator piscidefendens TaxID=2715756 RepID=UPI001408911A|nr:nucleoside hydrolase [Cochlodiniinecator piscidefendens]